MRPQHTRGMLARIDHPELCEIVVPSKPLRLHGTDKISAGPSPTIGQHNAEIYGGWLGLSSGEIAKLREHGVIRSAVGLCLPSTARSGGITLRKRRKLTNSAK
ncbi:MAG: hypothetical protein WA633_14930 [Stellaceae bacterium]